MTSGVVELGRGMLKSPNTGQVTASATGRPLISKPGLRAPLGATWAGVSLAM
jgi:hypothetical protein